MLFLYHLIATTSSHPPTQRSFFEVALWTFVVTLLGLGVAGFATFKQLREIRKSLTRFPKLRIGFFRTEFQYGQDKKLVSHKTYKVARRPDEDHYDIDAEIVLVNVGSLSAQGILVNIWVPLVITAPAVPPSKQIRNSKMNVYSFNFKNINPGDGTHITISFRIPNNTNGFSLKLNTSVKDAKEQLTNLRIKIANRVEH